MFIKPLTKFAAVLAFSSLATVAQAATINLAGSVDTLSGAFAALLAAGTPFTGELEFDTNLTAGQVLLGGFCFTDDASGLPPASPTCGALSAVPILATGETTFDGTPLAPGALLEQAGTTFDGTSGLLAITAYSPTFGLPIYIDLTFNNDGTGSLAAANPALGTAAGVFTWTGASEVPVPAAAWLFGSALVGLAGVGRRRTA